MDKLLLRKDIPLEVTREIDISKGVITISDHCEGDNCDKIESKISFIKIESVKTHHSGSSLNQE